MDKRKEKGALLDNLHSVNRNVTMWNDEFGKMIVENPENLNHTQIADILEKHYQFVELNPEDTIKLSGRATSKVQALAG